MFGASSRGAGPLPADLLSACLTAIEQGDATLESCLAEHPAQADALRPLLETALAARAVLTAEPPLDVRERLRGRVLAAAAAAPPVPAPRPETEARRSWGLIGAALARIFRQRDGVTDAALGELLAASLVRIEAGEATLESSLAAQPARAAELRPLLETALATRGALERGPSTAVRARLRSKVLAAAAPRPVPVLRRPLWQPAATAALALVLLAALSIPVGMLANDRAVPGDWNYGLKRTGERVRLAVTLDNGERRSLHLALAQRREREIQTLLDQNRTEYLPQAVRAFNIEVGNVAESLNRGSAPSLIEARRIAEASARQEEVLKQVAEQASPPVRAAAEEALSTVAQTRSAAIQAVEQRDPQLARALEQAPPPTPTPTPARSGGISAPPATVAPSRTSTVPTLVPEPAATATATVSPTVTATPGATATATPAATPTVTATVTPAPTATATPLPSATASPVPTPPPAAPTVPISAAAAQASAVAQPRTPTVLPAAPTLPPAVVLIPTPTPTPTPTPSSRVSTEVPAPSTPTATSISTPTATPRPTETPAVRTPTPAPTPPPTPVRTPTAAGPQALMLGQGTNTLVYVGRTPVPLTTLLAPIMGQVRQVRVYTPGGIGLVVYTPGQTTFQPVVVPGAWLEIDLVTPAQAPSPNLVPGLR